MRPFFRRKAERIPRLRGILLAITAYSYSRTYILAHFFYLSSLSKVVYRTLAKTANFLSNFYVNSKRFRGLCGNLLHFGTVAVFHIPALKLYAGNG